MTSTTFSAPQWSEEDERRESEELTEDQKQRIYSDLFGSRCDVDNDDEVRIQLETAASVRLVEEIESIPERKKAAYTEAMIKCPKLISRETNLKHFLRREDCNPDAAADRIVRHWTLRKKLFGASSFHPMTLTEDGALDDNDIVLLKTGCLQFLPNDRQGRTVLYLNKSAYNPKKHPRNTFLRCLFYMLSSACGQETTRRNGLVWVCNYKVRDEFCKG